MKKILSYLLLCGVVLFVSNCATILSDKNYSVSFSSVPKGADIEIIDGRGNTIFTGTTPVTLNLAAGQSYFKKASYRIRFSKVGYDDMIVPLNASIDGWYFGNLAIGGILGLLIIDPITGAMFKLDQEFVNVALNQSTSSIDPNSLQVYQIEDIPEHWKAHLQCVF